jgi:hypothetical protein
MVRFLEFSASIKSLLEIVVSTLRVPSFNESKDLILVDEVSAPINDSVGNLSDQNNKSGRSVVILRVGPNHKDGMHNRHEEVSDLLQLKRIVG